MIHRPLIDRLAIVFTVTWLACPCSTARCGPTPGELGQACQSVHRHRRAVLFVRQRDARRLRAVRHGAAESRHRLERRRPRAQLVGLLLPRRTRCWASATRDWSARGPPTAVNSWSCRRSTRSRPATSATGWMSPSRIRTRRLSPAITRSSCRSRESRPNSPPPATWACIATRFRRPGEPHLLINVTNALGRGTCKDGEVRVRAESHEVEGSSARSAPSPSATAASKSISSPAATNRSPAFGPGRGIRFRPRPKSTGSDVGVDLVFEKTAAPAAVELKVGLSYVSIENARANLEDEAGKLDFDQVLAKAKEEWETRLATIRVEGGSEKERTIFYTALSHALQMPTAFSDADGEYLGFDGTSIKRTASPITPTCRSGTRSARRIRSSR